MDIGIVQVLVFTGQGLEAIGEALKAQKKGVSEGGCQLAVDFVNNFVRLSVCRQSSI